MKSQAGFFLVWLATRGLVVRNVLISGRPGRGGGVPGGIRRHGTGFANFVRSF